MNTCTEILLVEDDPGDVRLALEVLRELHMAERCVVVNDGEEAIDFLHARGAYSQRAPGMPRVIVLDLKMPRKTGFEVLQWLRHQPQLKCMIVVVMASSLHPSDIYRAYELGCNSYLSKPGNVDQLAEMVELIYRYWLLLNLNPDLTHARNPFRPF